MSNVPKIVEPDVSHIADPEARRVAKLFEQNFRSILLNFPSESTHTITKVVEKVVSEPVTLPRYRGEMSINSNDTVFTLEHDRPVPGPNKAYCTNPDGIKGWWDFSSFDCTWRISVNEDGEEPVTMNVGAGTWLHGPVGTNAIAYLGGTITGSGTFTIYAALDSDDAPTTITINTTGLGAVVRPLGTVTVDAVTHKVTHILQTQCSPFYDAQWVEIQVVEDVDYYNGSLRKKYRTIRIFKYADAEEFASYADTEECPEE